MNDVKAVKVNIWGKFVGAVASTSRGQYMFEYSKDFAKSGLDLSPVHMSITKLENQRKVHRFPLLSPQTFYGLPGLLADALPDKFGNALIDEYLSRHGVPNHQITVLQRLLYVGKRSMGALEFEPASKNTRNKHSNLPLDVAHIVEDARRALRGEFTNIAQDIIDVGSSAGGARAKAVIGWNPATNEVVSGQFDLPPDFEHWLLKFDVGQDKTLGTTAGFGRIEYAHYLMAKAAGIQMSECRLHEEGDRAHFMTKRFDRDGNQKLHMQSLCGLAHLDFNMPHVHSYEQYLRTILELNLGAPALSQAWRRCAFNVAAVNCDDHTKNFAFLMDSTGKWQLAPAYDNCFSHNPETGKWTSKHQLKVRDKAWDITAQDLFDLADEYDIDNAHQMLEQVNDAIAQWPQFGQQAGVPTEAIGYIQNFHPNLNFTRQTYIHR